MALHHHRWRPAEKYDVIVNMSLLNSIDYDSLPGLGIFSFQYFVKNKTKLPSRQRGSRVIEVVVVVVVVNQT